MAPQRDDRRGAREPPGPFCNDSIGVLEGPAPRCDDNLGVREGPGPRCDDYLGVQEGPGPRCDDYLGVREGPAPCCDDYMEVQEAPAPRWNHPQVEREAPGALGNGNIYALEPPDPQSNDRIWAPEAPAPWGDANVSGGQEMRPMLWDNGEVWDDPNAYWADSGNYILEPGDPGYVIPPPAEGEPKPITKPSAMSSNETPDNRNLLLALGLAIHDGQVSIGATVGLHHHTATTSDVALKKLEGDPAAAPASAANKGSQLLYRGCVDLTGEAQTALQSLSDGAVKEYLSGYRNALVNVHGGKPNAGWVAAGFPVDTTQVPRTTEDRLALLTAARAYLTAHPTYAATMPRPTGPPLVVDAAGALALATEFQAARTLINTREAEQELCKNARDADVEALRKEVSGTIAELRGLLSAADPRWETFGLNIPAHPTPPVAIPSLTLTPLGGGKVLAEWPYATRMEMTRLFLQRMGTDAAALNIADPKDLAFTLKDLTPGSTIKVYVVAHNAGGDSAPSPTVTAVVA